VYVDILHCIYLLKYIFTKFLLQFACDFAAFIDCDPWIYGCLRNDTKCVALSITSYREQSNGILK
jgi:hypothetical protein